MKRDLEEELVKKYPNLYRHYRGNIMHTCMGWGFECSDGWYDLLDRGSAKLEKMIEALDPLARVNTYASQVKEKYGTLRFYMDGSTDAMEKVCEEMENESEKTCERCGKPGRIRGSGWYYTACDTHTRERDKKDE